MFKNAIELTEISGFKIRVDPSWLLIAALVVWGLSSSYFPEKMPGYSQSSYVVFSVISMLGLFSSVILHELAHSLVARRFDLNVGSITLFIFGGVAELEQEPRDPMSEFWIAIAGPIMSAILAGAAYGFVTYFNPLTSIEPLVKILEYLWQINLLLAIFNLVPAFPLDGGRVFRAALWAYRGDLISATRTASTVGTGFGWFLILAGVIGLISRTGIGGLWYIIIGFFVISASRGSYMSLITKEALKGQTIKKLMTTNVTTVSPADTVFDTVENVMLTKNISFLPVERKGELLGFVDMQAVNKVKRDEWKDLKISNIYSPVSKDNTIGAAMGVDDVLKHMSKTGIRKLMVVSGNKLLGVIALADLLNYLALRTSFAHQPSSHTY